MTSKFRKDRYRVWRVSGVGSNVKTDAINILWSVF